jgi:hypothetical protein
MKEKGNIENLEAADQIQIHTQSKMEKLSFLISLAMSVSGCLILSNTIPSLDALIYLPLIYCILPLVGVTGVGFGIAGLIEKNRKKHFAVLGLIINVIAFLPVLLMWILGLMQGMPFSCIQDPSFCFK